MTNDEQAELDARRKQYELDDYRLRDCDRSTTKGCIDYYRRKWKLRRKKVKTLSIQLAEQRRALEALWGLATTAIYGTDYINPDDFEAKYNTLDEFLDKFKEADDD